MLFWSIIYIIFIAVLVFIIPDSVWVKCLGKIKENFDLSKKLDDFKLKSTAGRGRALTSLLSAHILYSGNESCKLTKNFPEYKIYTQLVEDIIRYSNTYGASRKKVLESIRDGVVKDIRFELKLGEEKKGAIAQFIIIIIVIWFFIYFIEYTVQKYSNPLVYCSIALLHFLGIYIFAFSVKKQRLKSFKKFTNFFYTLYSLRSLSEAGLSWQESLGLARYNEITISNDKELNHIKVNLVDMVDSWRQTGRPIKAELDELVKEVWFVYDEKINKFLKKTVALKFIILTIFFLFSYFIYLFSFFRFFLIE